MYYPGYTSYWFSYEGDSVNRKMETNRVSNITPGSVAEESSEKFTVSMFRNPLEEGSIVAISSTRW